MVDIETHFFLVLRNGAQPNVVDGRPDETDVDQREAKRCVWSRTVDEQPSRYFFSSGAIDVLVMQPYTRVLCDNRFIS